MPYEESHAYKGGRALRPYQVLGVNWLLNRWHAYQNAILADEMGLGKTAQTVTFLEHLCRVNGIRGPFLVVCPLSTIEHWRRECENWTDFSVCVYHDKAEGRAVIRDTEWSYVGCPRDVPKFNVLITTYEIAATDIKLLSPYAWQAIVVDEGHRLRGTNSKLKACLNVRAEGHLVVYLGYSLPQFSLK
jgi:chromodomain-helicase-DNA-binding protein 7